MTKKDYELIADCIRAAADKETVALLLAAALGEDNPRFDRKKFLDACEIHPVPIFHTL